jgi:integrase
LQVRDGIIVFSRAKTGVRVELPVAPELQEAIEKAGVVGSTTFLVSSHGRPFTVAGFGNWFRQRCDEAGLNHCSAHGVRKTAAGRAAENGSTTAQLMAVFGWLTMKEAERYTRAAARRRLSRDAAKLLRR